MEQREGGTACVWLPHYVGKEDPAASRCWDPQVVNVLQRHLPDLPALLHAFGGDMSLKVMQQMMAASQAGRDLIYHAFGTTYRGRPLVEWIDELQDLVAARQLTVGELYRAIIKATPGTNLFEEVHTVYAK